MQSQPLRVGIGGPVGSGKTALTLALCRAMRERYQVAVVTNDIYTQEDAAFLVRHEALAAERIIEPIGPKIRQPRPAFRLGNQDVRVSLERFIGGDGQSASSCARSAPRVVQG